MLHPSLSSRQPKRSSKLQESTPLICFTASLLQGQMRLYLYLLQAILICLSRRYFSVDIKLELHRNILKFGYGINYKYEGMLAHSFDRFYVIAKFSLPTLDDLKL